jgi:hypothetical protein
MKDQIIEIYDLSEDQVKALTKFGQKHPEGSSFDEYIISFPELSGVTEFRASKYELGSNTKSFITALPRSTKTLILSECGITLDLFESTLECIASRLINISFIDLSDNFDVDDNIINLELLKFPLMPTSLKGLDLGNNNFGKHIFSLAETLPLSILELDIYGNKMGENASVVFKIVKKRLPYLEVLEADCLGSGIDTSGVLKRVSKLNNLTKFSFVSNNLDKDCLEVIKTFPVNMPLLKEIDIKYFNSSTVNAEDIEELENWFKDHNNKFEPLIKGLFAGFMAYKDANSGFCLNKDTMSHLIGNHYEPVVQLYQSP